VTLHVGGRDLPARPARETSRARHARGVVHAARPRPSDAVRRARQRSDASSRSARDHCARWSPPRAEDGSLREGAVAHSTLFITPGTGSASSDALVRISHLPRSTLLMLVSAFAGYDRIRRRLAQRAQRTASSVTATRCCSTGCTDVHTDDNSVTKRRRSRHCA
jgi:S-adenosylmethionine:tRNA ribosyltransferase-isomerase